MKNLNKQEEFICVILSFKYENLFVKISFFNLKIN